MADTYTQGYRKGFELAGKPLYKKKSVGIHYPLGFERMMKKAFENFENATRNSIYKGDLPNNKIYCTSVKGKKRYINPLVYNNNKVTRISDVSSIANNDINNFLNIKLHDFIGFNFDFKPYIN